MTYINTKDNNILQSIILIVVLYAWISLLATILGIFYPIAIFATWIISCVFLYYKKILIFNTPTKNFLSYILIAIAFTLFISYFTVPTIFSGRDQGSLSEAAMRLSNNHSLIQHTDESTVFFEINEKGKALNFPGFFYTVDGGLITQFPLPYISFISGFFGIFNIYGFVIANALLLFTSTLALLAIAKNYMSHRYTLVFALILLSSFAIGWFAKFTLSENIAGMLLWSSLILYIFLKKTPTKITYFTLFLTTSLLLLTRIEGLWFFAIFAFLILRTKSITSFIKKDIWWNVFFPITLLFVTTCAVFIMNIPFFLTMLKASSSASSEIASTSTLITKTTYLFSIYALYGLLLPLLFTTIAVITAIFSKRYRVILLPFIIVAPLMIYYIFPNISGDHPWMLRRFVFALLPATILVSVSFISYIKSSNLSKRVLKYTMISLLLFANIPAFISFATYAENKTLYEQVVNISEKFDENDLILIDKNVAGDGWSMIASPLNSLLSKHSVYFFNPNDFQKINTNNFEHIFLITSNQNESLYTDVLFENMRYNTKYQLTVNQLDISKKKTFPPSFPKQKTTTVRGVIYELTK